MKRVKRTSYFSQTIVRPEVLLKSRMCEHIWTKKIPAHIILILFASFILHGHDNVLTCPFEVKVKDSICCCTVVRVRLEEKVLIPVLNGHTHSARCGELYKWGWHFQLSIKITKKI